MTPLEPLLRELVGEALRRRRRAQRRTLAEVAARAGMSMQHLSDVERGRKDPSSEILAAICGALDLPLGQLLELAGAAQVAQAGTVSEQSAAGRRPVVLDLTSGPRSRGHSVAPSSARALEAHTITLSAA